VYREHICGEVLGALTHQAAGSVDFVRAALEQVRCMLEESMLEPPVQGYCAPVIHFGTRGRPIYLSHSMKLTSIFT